MLGIPESVRDQWKEIERLIGKIDPMLKSDYVPYSGATGAVDLGAQNLTTTGLGTLGTGRIGDGTATNTFGKLSIVNTSSGASIPAVMLRNESATAGTGTGLAFINTTANITSASSIPFGISATRESTYTTSTLKLLYGDTTWGSLTAGITLFGDGQVKIPGRLDLGDKSSVDTFSAGSIVNISSGASVPAFLCKNEATAAGTGTGIAFTNTTANISSASSIPFGISAVRQSTYAASSLNLLYGDAQWGSMTTGLTLLGSGKVGIGTTTPTTPFHLINTTEQFRIGYDANNYLAITVGEKGRVTFGGAGDENDFNYNRRMGIRIGTPANTLQVNVENSADGVLISHPISTNGLFVGNYFRVAAVSSDAYKKGAIFFERTGSGGVGDLHLATNSSTSSANVSLSDVRLTVKSSGNVGIGTTTPSALLHAISTTEQLRIGYDASNYFNAVVDSTGGVTFDAVGTGALFTFSDTVKASGYQSSDGSAGLTQDVEVRNAAGDGTTTLGFKNGILTSVT
jgi:trimeric autotransporter adhesin